MDGGIAIVIIILSLIIYFLPYIVAVRRNHNDRMAIGLLNLLAGWTGLGWLIAIVWSGTGNVKKSLTLE